MTIRTNDVQITSLDGCPERLGHKKSGTEAQGHRPTLGAGELARCVVLNDELNFTGHGDLGALGATKERGVKLVDLYLKVGGKRRENLDVTTSGGNLERLHALAARLDVHELSWLHAEGRTVYKLAINENVTVNDELTSLSGRAGKTSANDEGVETHFEELDQVLTGQALRATSFLEDNLQLSFANAVLGTKTLLLPETNGIVRVGLALGAAVLTGSVGTLLEILGCLGGQCDAEGTRQTSLATGT